jgi:hypothetical protein
LYPALSTWIQETLSSILNHKGSIGFSAFCMI